MNTIFCKLVMPSHMFRKTVRLDSQIHYMCVYMRTCMYIYCMYILCMYVCPYIAICYCLYFCSLFLLVRIELELQQKPLGDK